MPIPSQAFPTPGLAAEACAIHMLACLEEALARAPLASLAISGGATPVLLFRHLAKAPFHWDRVHLFWVDERGVPPTDEQSNFRLAEEHLLLPARIPNQNIHRILAELPAGTAAHLYDGEIRKFFGLEGAGMPRFDVMHRGIGPDAHTASLFPGQPLIDDREGLTAAVYVEKFAQWRITLLPGVLRAARHTVMLVTGADKADALHAIFHGAYDPRRYPAQVVPPREPNVAWFLDEAAAQGLERARGHS